LAKRLASQRSDWLSTTLRQRFKKETFCWHTFFGKI